MDDVTKMDAAVAVLRVIVGLTVAAHGYGKVFRGGRLASTGGWFDSIGMRPGWLHARMAAGTEIAAGLLLALGLLTPIAGAAVVALMVVAAWTVHRGNGFFIVGDGWEYNFVLAGCAVVAGTAGPGRLSLDHALSDGWLGVQGGWSGFLLAAVGGVLAAVVHLAVFFRPPAAEEALTAE